MSEIKAQTDVLLVNEEQTVMVLLQMAGNIVLSGAVSTRKPGAAAWSGPTIVKEQRP